MIVDGYVPNVRTRPPFCADGQVVPRQRPLLVGDRTYAVGEIVPAGALPERTIVLLWRNYQIDTLPPAPPVKKPAPQPAQRGR